MMKVAGSDLEIGISGRYAVVLIFDFRVSLDCGKRDTDYDQTAEIV